MSDVKTPATNLASEAGRPKSVAEEAKDAVGTVLHLEAPDQAAFPLQPAHVSAEAEAARIRKAHQEIEQHRSPLIGPRAD